MTSLEIARRARQALSELTGSEVVSISSLRQDADGWCVNVEIVELKRIPDSSDVLATYETFLDQDGNVISYRRIRRYNRGQIFEEEGI